MTKQLEQALADIEGATEQELRALDVPWFEDSQDLIEYIVALTERSHDYGTCVYAMSLASVAASYFVAKRLGVSGFQASCADMDVLRRTRGLERFMICDLSKALFPQYDLRADLDKALSDVAPWLAEEAAKRLADSDRASSAVIAHWRRLANPTAKSEA